MQEMPKALRNSTVTSFLREHGLELWSVEYLSAEYRPGTVHLCLMLMAGPMRIGGGQSQEAPFSDMQLGACIRVKTSCLPCPPGSPSCWRHLLPIEGVLSSWA